MRALVLSLALLAGCATQHTHTGDCASCAGFTIVQDQVSNGLLKQEIYKAVGEALNQRAAVAPVTSRGGSK